MANGFVRVDFTYRLALDGRRRCHCRRPGRDGHRLLPHIERSGAQRPLTRNDVSRSAAPARLAGRPAEMAFPPIRCESAGEPGQHRRPV